METTEGYDPGVWDQMANQLGLQGLAIPEEFGGSGYTFIELGIVLEEMGRSLLCAPFFSSVVLATAALLASGDDAAKKEFLPGIASGETIATARVHRGQRPLGRRGHHARSHAERRRLELSGTKMFVLDGHTANLMIVAGSHGRRCQPVRRRPERIRA